MLQSSLDSLKIAEQMLDIIPATMRLIRHELRTFARPEITVPQLRVLAHISRGVTKASELAELQGVSLAAISKMVDAMAEQGFIARQFKTGNRKQIFLALTDNGKKHYQKIRTLAKKNISHEIKKCSIKERKQLHLGLLTLEKILIQHLNAKLENSSRGESGHSP